MSLVPFFAHTVGDVLASSLIHDQLLLLLGEDSNQPLASEQQPSRDRQPVLFSILSKGVAWYLARPRHGADVTTLPNYTLVR